jgi:acyl carrier protein
MLWKLRSRLDVSNICVLIRPRTKTREPAVQSSITLRVREIIAEHFHIDPNQITDEARFRDDLGADWLDRLEVIIAIEDQIDGFELSSVVADRIDTVGDLMRAIEGAH